MTTNISSKLNASYNINPISNLIYGFDVDQILLDSLMNYHGLVWAS
jgi:hypothetical protein